jgi:hypothetical protein
MLKIKIVHFVVLVFPTVNLRINFLIPYKRLFQGMDVSNLRKRFDRFSFSIILASPSEIFE